MGFYSVHNPERIANLDVILNQYTGKEELLIERLEQKYSADLSYARREVAIQRHDPGGTTPVPSRTPPEGVQAAQYQHHQQKLLPHSVAGAMTSGSPQSTPSNSAELLHRGSSNIGPRGDHAHTATLPPPRTRGTSGGASTTTTASTAASSSSYMTYLADQIKSNFEGLLPASSGNSSVGGNNFSEHFVPPAAGAGPRGGGGWAGGGPTGGSAVRSSSTVLSPSSLSPSPSPLSAPRRQHHRDIVDLSSTTANSPPKPTAPHPSASAVADTSRPFRSDDRGFYNLSNGSGGGGGSGGSGVSVASSSLHVPPRSSLESTPVWRGSKNSRAAGKVGEEAGGASGVGVSDWHQQGPDPILAARMKALEEERAGLLAACRRLQGKAEAATREVRLQMFVQKLFIFDCLSVVLFSTCSCEATVSSALKQECHPVLLFLFRILAVTCAGDLRVMGLLLT